MAALSAGAFTAENTGLERTVVWVTGAIVPRIVARVLGYDPCYAGTWLRCQCLLLTVVLRQRVLQVVLNMYTQASVNSECNHITCPGVKRSISYFRL